MERSGKTSQRCSVAMLPGAPEVQDINQEFEIEIFLAVLGHVGTGFAAKLPSAPEHSRQAQRSWVIEPHNGISAGQAHRHGRAIVSVDNPTLSSQNLRQFGAALIAIALNPSGPPEQLVEMEQR